MPQVLYLYESPRCRSILQFSVAVPRKSARSPTFKSPQKRALQKRARLKAAKVARCCKSSPTGCPKAACCTKATFPAPQKPTCPVAVHQKHHVPCKRPALPWLYVHAKSRTKVRRLCTPLQKLPLLQKCVAQKRAKVLFCTRSRIMPVLRCSCTFVFKSCCIRLRTARTVLPFMVHFYLVAKVFKKFLDQSCTFKSARARCTRTLYARGCTCCTGSRCTAVVRPGCTACKNHVHVRLYPRCTHLLYARCTTAALYHKNAGRHKNAQKRTVPTPWLYSSCTSSVQFVCTWLPCKKFQLYLVPDLQIMLYRAKVCTVYPPVPAVVLLYPRTQKICSHCPSYQFKSSWLYSCTHGVPRSYSKAHKSF